MRERNHSHQHENRGHSKAVNLLFQLNTSKVMGAADRECHQGDIRRNINP